MTRYRPAPVSERVEVPLDGVIGRDDEQWLAIATVVTRYDFDPSYGSDADGNRGVPRWDVEHDITLHGVEDPEQTMTVLPDPLRRELILTAVRAYVEDDRNAREPYDPDDDCDRAYEEWRDR